MPVHLQWLDIGVRLLCAIAAACLIGYDRGEHGRPAGLRTTILVTLAACVSMIQVNLLLPLAGKLPNSFIVMDLMRLPLGILSGMGFIGGGAILRRDNLVIGVTTAATLWFVTVIGLCFGGGQIALGWIGTLIALVVLVVLRSAEERIKRERQGNFRISIDPSGPTEDDIRGKVTSAGFDILNCAASFNPREQVREFNCLLRWKAGHLDAGVPLFVNALVQHPGVLRIDWTPEPK